MAKLIFLFVYVGTLFAEDGRHQMIRDFLKQRERIMKEMTESFGDDSFFQGQSMFDQSLVDNFDNSFFGNNKFASNVSIDQVQLENGDIKVVITPKSKNIELDIKVSQDRLTVSSKTVVEQEDESSAGKSFSKSMSSSSQSVGIPLNYELGTPTTEGDSVVYVMTKKKSGKTAVKPLDMTNSI